MSLKVTMLLFMWKMFENLYGLSAPIMKENVTNRVLKYNLQSCRVTLLPNPKTKKMQHWYGSL